MSKREKRLEKFLQNPRSTHYLDIQNILLDHGFEKVSGKGSHMKFKHPSLPSEDSIIFPIHNGDTKRYYKKFAALILKKAL